jgi:hypothetical protein
LKGISEVRRDARWALGLGATLVAMATASAAYADVVPIDLDECSIGCVSPMSDAEGASAGGVALYLPGGGRARDPSGLRPDLIFDPDNLPSFLVQGPPSAIASVEAGIFDGPGGSPYDFFETIIDVPHSADGPAFAAVSSTRSLTSRLSNFLWASNDFFGPPQGDVASRRGVPVSADGDVMIGRLWKPVPPTLRPSTLSEPPPPPVSSATEPFGQVGNKARPSGEFPSDGAGLGK